MMQVHLYIRFADLAKYLDGESIEAATKDNASYIFRRNSEQLIHISVDPSEIIKAELRVLNGMVSGEFMYFTIQRG